MILIGGAGSSGSTLLRKKLSTHKDIFSGGEINFFNKERLFEDWNKNKLKILPYFPFFTTSGWDIYRRSMLTRKEYGWNKNEIRDLLKQSKSINEFVNVFFDRGLKNNNSKLWIEKTPSNAYSFKLFLKQFQEGKVIHITRNPLDSIASMYNKNKPIYYGVGTWLYNNAAALVCENSKRYLRVKYEDLVLDPKPTFQRISNFIGIDIAGLNLLGEKKMEMNLIDSWKNNPNAAISTTSMGSFYNLQNELQNEIYTALHCIQISDAHSKVKDFKYVDFYAISKKLEYNSDISPNKEMVIKIKKDLKLHKMERFLKNYQTGGKFFPLKIKE